MLTTTFSPQLNTITIINMHKVHYTFILDNHAKNDAQQQFWRSTPFFS